MVETGCHPIFLIEGKSVMIKYSKTLWIAEIAFWTYLFFFRMTFQFWMWNYPWFEYFWRGKDLQFVVCLPWKSIHRRACHPDKTMFCRSITSHYWSRFWYNFRTSQKNEPHEVQRVYKHRHHLIKLCHSGLISSILPSGAISWCFIQFLRSAWRNVTCGIVRFRFSDYI